MKKPLLIIVTGASCSGKTTIGKKIAEEFQFPFINRDEIKELIFDKLGWSDREWSHKVGLAGYDILYYFAESLLAAGKSFVVETTFRPDPDEKRFLYLKKEHDFEPLQILCEAGGEVLFERFKKRSESGKRHPGHVDDKNYEMFNEDVVKKGEHETLDIGGKVIKVDTTDFEKIDYGKLFGEIKPTIK